MFKQILFLSAIIFSFVASAQNVTKLDANNGFRKFKFGMSPKQFSNLVASPSPDLNFRGVTEYKYIGKDIKDFYGVKIDEISLTFYKNKLYQIMVSFGTVYRKYSDREYDLIDDALRGVFGTKNHDCRNSGIDEKLNCLIWDGKKVRLEHIRFNLSEADGTRKNEFNYIQGYIFFNFKPLERAQQNSEL